KISLPLDLLLVASANPEDYTNRGRIITPLKDRFGSQIRTHYPLDADTEIAIMRQEARPLSIGETTVELPDYLERVVATFSQLARSSSSINQRSGVSVRLSVSNAEVIGANAMRRALRAGEHHVVPRVSDLEALAASSSGKIEIESMDDGREGQLLEQLVKAAVLTVYREVVDPTKLTNVVVAFEAGKVAHSGEAVTSAELAGLCEEIAPLAEAVESLIGSNQDEPARAAAVEFILEGLHLSKRLNKDTSATSSTYRGRNA
ncbi:MAG TPA: magnesium chelatase, partial [Ilumatobacteraceae bacterium]|nr:magnesium chelatase [Ilumatobacteraceae bacterium]